MVLETIKNEFPISIGSCLFAIAIALSVPATALADANDKSQPEASASGDAIDDACYGLNQNEDWYRLFNLFSASFKAGDYDKALEYTSAHSKRFVPEAPSSIIRSPIPMPKSAIENAPNATSSLQPTTSTSLVPPTK